MPMTNALVPTAPVFRESKPAQTDGRASADFVVHLIATAARLPQTRDRRRAEPEEALAAYRALGHRPAEPGRALSRSF
jgi:hypothetical protein